MGSHISRTSQQPAGTQAKASDRSHKNVPGDILQRLKSGYDDDKIALLQGLIQSDNSSLTSEFMAEVQSLTVSANIGLRFWAKKILNKYGCLVVENKGPEQGSSLSFEQLLQKLETAKESSFVSLETIKKLCDTKNPLVIQPLIGYLKKCSDVVQISYLTRQLGLNFPSESLLPVLVPFLEHTDDRVVANTIEGIEQIDSSKSVVYISRMLNHGSNRVRANAAKALKKFDSEKTLIALSKMLEAKDKPHYVISACHAVKELKDELYIEYLAPLIDDGLVYEHALAALLSIGGEKAASIISASQKSAVGASVRQAQPLCSSPEHPAQTTRQEAQVQDVKVARDVFISHSNLNKEIADQLCTWLEGHQIKCWIAPRDILGGLEWSDAIAQGLENCSVMSIILSEHSNKSKQVLREVQMADKLGKKILPIRLGEVSLSRSFDYYLGVSHWISCPDKLTPDDLNKILDSCRSLLSPDNAAKSENLICEQEAKVVEENVGVAAQSAIKEISAAADVPKNLQTKTVMPDHNLQVARIKTAAAECPAADAMLRGTVSSSAPLVIEAANNDTGPSCSVSVALQPDGTMPGEANNNSSPGSMQKDDGDIPEAATVFISWLCRFTRRCFRMLGSFISSFSGPAAEAKAYLQQVEARLRTEPESLVLTDIFRQAAGSLPIVSVIDFKVDSEPASSRVEVNLNYELDYDFFSKKYMSAALFVLERIAREKEEHVIALAGHVQGDEVQFRYRKNFPFRFSGGKNCERVVVLETWRNRALDNLETRRFSVDEDTWQELSRLCETRLLIQISFWDSEKELIRREDYWPDSREFLPLRSDASQPRLMIFSSLTGSLTLSSFNARKGRTLKINYHRPKDEVKDLHEITCNVIFYG